MRSDPHPRAVGRSLKFRQDISGLRAVAVAAVVLFHFRLGGFSGGFIGVDVFFVISGFLMTQIIVSRMQAARFSVLGFYFDRARRIIPALAVMLVAVLVLGYVIAAPDDYRLLGKHVVGGALFLSNVQFYLETNYFAPASAENWLLHTWSLGVEWQFYLVYPLYMLVLFRLGGLRAVRWGVIAGTLASFGLCLLMAARDATGAFYLGPPRAWEMLAGGLVFLFPARIPSVGVQRAIEWAGLAVIVLATRLLDSHGDWPGWLTLVPIAATAAVLIAARTQSRLLGSPPVAMLGRISYSVYLWHWPVAVALLYTGEAADIRWRVAGVAASLVLGWLSWRFVERPTASIGRVSGRPASPIHPSWRAHALFATAIAAVLLPALVVWRGNGLPARMPEVARRYAASIQPDQTLRRNCFDEPPIDRPCLLGDPAKPVGAILIGDSHALALAPAVQRAMQATGSGRLYFRAYPGCASVPNAGYPQIVGDRCLSYNRTYLPPLLRGRFAGTPVIVVNSVRGVLSNANLRFVDGTGITSFSPADYEARFTRTICGIAVHHPTALVAIYPDWDTDVAAERTRQLMLSADPPPAVQTLAQHRRRHAAEMALLDRVAKRCGATLLDPAPLLCPNGLCSATDHGRAKYYNAYHLNDLGAAFVEPLFEAYFANRSDVLENQRRPRPVMIKAAGSD